MLIARGKLISATRQRAERRRRVFLDTRKTPFDFNFSDIEIQIAKLLFEKKSNIEISNIIFRDISTVEYHIRLMKAKTACKSRHEIRDYIIKMCWHEDGTFQNLK